MWCGVRNSMGFVILFETGKPAAYVVRPSVDLRYDTGIICV